MAVHCKFRSAKDFFPVAIDGNFVSVSDLKDRIFEAKRLCTGTDFDISIYDAQTDQEYADESALIPKNTSVIVRRLPGLPRKPIVVMSKIAESDITTVSELTMVDRDSSVEQHPEVSDMDVFGSDIFDIPEATALQSNNAVHEFPSSDKSDEDMKINALVEGTARDWQRQIEDSGCYTRGVHGRVMAQRGLSQMERKIPPEGYVCHRCGKPGHFIHHCPTNGDPDFDNKKFKARPSGYQGTIVNVDEATFTKEMEGFSSSCSTSDIPPELLCPLCKKVMNDAVLTSKCCFSSFCNKCIRDYILSKAICTCGASSIQDDLIPNITLRATINRICECPTSSSSGITKVEDMASSCFPAGSVQDNSVKKEVVSGMNTMKIEVESKGTVELLDVTKAKFQNHAMPKQVHEKALGEKQSKQKKHRRAPIPESATDSAGMKCFSAGIPFDPSCYYNPYWTNGRVPYLAYNNQYNTMAFMATNGQFLNGVPFGGFGAQNYTSPCLPKGSGLIDFGDLSELAINSRPMNHDLPMENGKKSKATKDAPRRDELPNKRKRKRSCEMTTKLAHQKQREPSNSYRHLDIQFSECDDGSADEDRHFKKATLRLNKEDNAYRHLESAANIQGGMNTSQSSRLNRW